MSSKRFDFPPDLPGWQLLYIAKSQYKNDWHSTFHTHDFVEIFYISDGTGFFVIGSQNYPVKKGDLIIINPHVTHTELSFVENPMEYYILGIDDIQFSDPDSFETNDFFLFSSPPEHDNYYFYLKNIYKEMKYDQEYCLDLCQSNASSFLYLLKRRISQEHRTEGTSFGNADCLKIRQYLDEHFSSQITLDKLADMVHMNKYYLVHCFTKEVGCSPINYLQARRIAESKHLLETSSLSVSEISNSLGFSSSNYFSQRFKKVVGISPADYRKAIQSGEDISNLLSEISG